MSRQRSKYLRPGPDCLVLADTFAVSVYRNGAATRHYANPSRLAIDHPETHAIPLLRHYANPSPGCTHTSVLDR
jgi:hypothetical protein